MPYQFGSPLDRPVNLSDAPPKLFFISSSDLLAVRPGTQSRSETYKSQDGGQSWIEMKQPTSPNVDPDSLSLHFTDTARGWLGSSSWIRCVSNREISPCYTVLFTTRDGGHSWRQLSRLLPVPFGTVRPFTLSFDDEQNGVALTGGTYLLRTADGGENWGLRDLSGVMTATSVSYAHGQLWVTGYTRSNRTVGTLDGVLAHSGDGGFSWQTYRLPTLLPRAVQFTNLTEGWLQARAHELPSALFHTRDGGQSWQQVWPQLTP
ncbi:MAG: hypothetical protein HY329_23020 [Chloroflexi bacterium]|nr:hypothetical protein [Chloroflexota bacterium]